MGLLKSIKSSRRKDNIARIAAEQVKAEKILELAMPKMKEDIEKQVRVEQRQGCMAEFAFTMQTKYGYGKKRLERLFDDYGDLLCAMFFETPRITCDEIAKTLKEESGFDLYAAEERLRRKFERGARA